MGWGGGDGRHPWEVNGTHGWPKAHIGSVTPIGWVKIGGGQQHPWVANSTQWVNDTHWGVNGTHWLVNSTHGWVNGTHRVNGTPWVVNSTQWVNDTHWVGQWHPLGQQQPLVGQRHPWVG